MTWITIKTTGTRWEAEWMQQLLAAHEIPARVVSQGAASHLGCGVPGALQVRPQDRWAALLLLSPIEENIEEMLDKAE
ncbi:MAG: hypothetical protein ACKO7W_07690 [Elainella sp.]